MRVIPFVIVLINFAKFDLCASDMIPTVAESTESDGEAVNVTTGNVSPRVPRLSVDTGFVFLNGEYVDSPYQITFSDSEISINETKVALSEFESWKNEKRIANGKSRSHSQQVRRQLRLLLDDGGSLVMFDGEPLRTLRGNDSYDLLAVLVNPDARKAFIEGERDWLPQSVNRPLWNKWIDEFECPEGFSERASEVISRVDQLLLEHETRLSARKALEASAYPLTVAGMLLVVVAVGHLLRHRPGLSDGMADVRVAKTNAIRGVLLIAALSALDLVWTVLVSRTGDMKELNPLGAAMIHDPAALIALKSITTFVAITILFVLRRHPVARQGTWWACLICTLLTVRWLTFNSMFV